MKLLFTLVIALSITVPASAQTLADLTHALVLQQQQLDRLQTAQNATLGPQNVAGYLDWVTPGVFNTLAVTGWVLQCGPSRPRVQVKLDGLVLTDTLVTPYLRTDVTAIYGPYCKPLGGLLPEVGAAALVDLTFVAPGPHVIALHLIATNGFTVDTNTLTFVK